MHWQTSSVPKGLLCVAADIPDGNEQEELDRRDLPNAAPDDFVKLIVHKPVPARIDPRLQQTGRESR